MKRQHPGAGPGNKGQRARPHTQQQKRQRKAQAQADKHQQRQRRALSQGEAQRRRHEGRGAGRGHRHRQHAGKEGAGAPAFLASELSPAVMEPTSNRPERFSPTANTSSAKPATAIGDLQLETPAHRSGRPGAAARWPDRSTSEAQPPRRRHRRSFRSRPLLPPWRASASAFIARIGSTQGMTFRIKPPTKAKTSASHRLRSPPSLPENSAGGTAPCGARHPAPASNHRRRSAPARRSDAACSHSSPGVSRSTSPSLAKPTVAARRS